MAVLSLPHLAKKVVNVGDPKFGTNPPDGTADNTSQILAAITEACGGAISGGVTAGRYATASLHFPKGYWRFTQRPRIVSMLNMEIFGDSSGGSFLVPMGTWGDETSAFELMGCYHCRFKDLTFLQVAGTSPTFDDVLVLDWDATKADRTTTGNMFENVQFRSIKWRNSAFAIGRFSGNTQVDNGTYRDISVNGQWDGSSTTLYQHGVQIGSGGSGNILNHFFYGLTSSLCRFNVFNNSVSTVGVWGGSFGNAEADIKQAGDVVMTVSGIRSEASQRFFQQNGGASYGAQIAFRDVLFNTSGLHADGRFIKMGYGGGLTLDNVAVNSSGGDPTIYVDVPSSRLAIATTGCRFEKPVADLVEMSAGSVGRVVQSHRAYCETASGVPSVLTASVDY